MNPKDFNPHRIDGQAALEEIRRLVRFLVIGWAPEYPRPDPNRGPMDQPPVSWHPIDKTALARVNGALTVQMKLLGKVLPDLRAMDLSAVVAQTDTLLADCELAQRARFLLEHQKRFADGPLPPLPPTLQ